MGKLKGDILPLIPPNLLKKMGVDVLCFQESEGELRRKKEKKGKKRERNRELGRESGK